MTDALLPDGGVRTSPTYPLEPDRAAMSAMAAKAAEVVADFVEGLPAAPAMNTDGAAPVPDALLRGPAEEPGDFAKLVDLVADAARHAIETAGPGYLAYVGGGGLYTSALAEFLARAFNRYPSLAAFAPHLVAMEHGVLQWLCRQFGLPAIAGGLVTTGGSMATLVALVAARTERLGDDITNGTLYITAHTHRCVAKAARIAGLRDDQIRVVPTTSDRRMDPAAAEALIAADRAAGRRPFLLVATAGTTDTGTVDPLGPLAAVAAAHDLWLHVDGAYGGFFQLTERGRARLAGIELADSIVLDPHKGLFLPHGTGLVLVRDSACLRRTYASGGQYLQDVDSDASLPDFADLGPELTREHRGLRLWLPLHVHGVAAFRAALDEKLDLAAYAYEELSREPELELPWPPDLSTVVLRMRDGDDATARVLARVNAGRRVHISSTRVDGRLLLRLCIIVHRTHRDRVAEAVDAIRHAARA